MIFTVNTTKPEERIIDTHSIKNLSGYYTEVIGGDHYYLFIDDSSYIYAISNNFGKKIEYIGSYSNITSYEVPYYRKKFIIYADEIMCRFDPFITKHTYKFIILYFVNGEFTGNIDIGTEFWRNLPSNIGKATPDIQNKYRAKNEKYNLISYTLDGHFHQSNSDEVPEWFKRIVSETVLGKKYDCLVLHDN